MKKMLKTLAIVFAFICVGATIVCATNSSVKSGEEQVKIYGKCRTCNGTGRVKEKETHWPCKGAGCAACDYKGYVERWVECSVCGGTGREQRN